MYYLVDIVQNVCLAKCENKTELHRAWLYHAQHVSRLELNYYGTPQPDFSLLSMTDSDKAPGMFTGEYIRRPLRVIDETGRIIDIRTWPEMYETLKPETKSNPVSYLSCGAKYHEHRTTGPAMLHKSLKQSFCTYDLTDDEDGVLPESVFIKQPRVRFGNHMNFEKADRRWLNKHNGSKSWKDQSKAERQYCKHKTKPVYTSLKQAALTPKESW